MVFLAAGMGGGTGTGAVPVAARVSKSIGAVTIAVVTTPFSFEMGRRQKNAIVGLQKLRQFTDTLITVPNDRLLKVAPEDLSLEMAFKLADDVLRQGISGIAELITENGLINVDFAHIRHVMKLGGGALMAIGTGEGEGKAKTALENALHHPLLDDIDITSANGIIANFSGGDDLTFAEVAETLSYLHEKTESCTEIIPGVINDPNLSNRAQVILIVTGLGALPIENAIPGAEKYLSAYASNAEKHKAHVDSQQNRYPMGEETGPDFSFSKSISQSSPAIVSSDLDVPAFLRKRIRG
jgi:cell division protein FtsZ